MNWELNVPKVLHLYWGLDPMHPLRWKTITTFKELNPEWRVILHRPTTPGEVPKWETGENQFTYTGPCAINGSDIEIQIHSMPSMSDVHRSDLLRWRLLATNGGVWADTDIIWTCPMDELECNTQAHDKATTFLSWWGATNEHRIGFLMSSGNNPFFAAVHDIAATNFQPTGYQQIGSMLLNSMGIRGSAHIVNMGRDMVYPLLPEQIFDYSSIHYDIRKGTVGIHWYAGHPLAGRYMAGKMRERCLIDRIK